MGIVPNFDMKGLQNYMEDRKKLLESLILRNLNYLGMKCIQIAKSTDTYIDRTGNLRNSIGYVIVKHGQILESQFPVDGRGPEYSQATESGEVVGEEFAKELAKIYSDGYALIIVAGMYYASYVEDYHHLPVLQPAENLAKSELDRVAQNIVNGMEKAA